MFTLRPRCLFFAFILLLVEVFIALYMHDRFVRPYVGDYLVVILLYCFFRAFLRLPQRTLAIGVLLFAFAVEGLQAIHIVQRLGLQNNRAASIIIGTGFEWMDLVAYTLGILTVLALDRPKAANR